MRDITRRGLSLVVSASMVLGLMPAPALADAGTAGRDAGAVKEVAPAEDGAANGSAGTDVGGATTEGFGGNASLSDIVDAAADAGAGQAAGAVQQAPVEMRLGEGVAVDLAAGASWAGVFAAPADGDYELVVDGAADGLVVECAADVKFSGAAVAESAGGAWCVGPLREGERRFYRLTADEGGAKVTVLVRTTTVQENPAVNAATADQSAADAAPAGQGADAAASAAEVPRALAAQSEDGDGTAIAPEPQEQLGVQTELVDLATCRISGSENLGYVVGTEYPSVTFSVYDASDNWVSVQNFTKVYYSSQGTELNQAPTEVGSYYVAARAKQGSTTYKGETQKLQFRVFATNDLSSTRYYAVLDPSSWSHPHTGNPIGTLNVTIMDYGASVQGGKKLSEGTDFALDHYETAEGVRLSATPSEIGEYYAVYTGKGQYTGSKRLYFLIYDSKDLSNYTVYLQGNVGHSDGMSEYGYEGVPVCPEARVIDTRVSEEPKLGTDYVVTYSNNNGIHQNGEYATLTVSPAPNSDFHGTQSVKYRITDTKDLRVYRYTYGMTLSTGAGESQTRIGTNGVYEFKYTGSPIKPTVSFVQKNGVTTPVEGTDFEVTYEEDDSSKDGQHSLTITAKAGSGFSGSMQVSYRVVDSYGLGNGTTTATPVSSWEGKIAEKPWSGWLYTTFDDTLDLFGVAWNVFFNGNSLVENKDYTVSKTEVSGSMYGDGGVMYVFSGKGDYTNTVSRCVYRIKKKSTATDISAATVTVASTVAYDGKAKTPEPKVTYGGRTLAKGTDYDVSYKNNVEPGTATVTVTGKGGYTGTKSASFKIVKTGWVKEGSDWYYYGADGSAAKGWQHLGGKWYYLDPSSGAMATGWRKIGGKWYFFDGSGAMLAGWQKLGGTWYYFDGSGAMATGWLKLGSTWYCFAGSGAMLTGWQRIGSAWYYFAPSGAMATGWLKLGSTWYCFAGSGAMLTGWQRIGSAWYYFNPSGAMATGWLRLGSTWYYFSGSGAMVTGRQNIGGRWYTFASGGAWVA